VDRGWIRDQSDSLAWIRGRLMHTTARVDLPILARLARFAGLADVGGQDFGLWAARLRASRDSAESRAADRGLGQGLARLLSDLGVSAAEPWRVAPTASLAVGFALAGRAWAIPVAALLAGYSWTFCEGQVSAAIKLVPLGQTAGQRMMSALAVVVPSLVDSALAMADDEIGACAPAAAMASAWHETQAVRLFRS
jgi:urease accessory protein